MVSRSGLQDRRGFDVSLKISMVLIAVGLIAMPTYNWLVGLLVAMSSGIAFITLERVSAPPANSPREFAIFHRRQPRRRPVLACLGDSLTHGNCSASITPEIPSKLCIKLGMELPKYGSTFADPVWVVNCGQNGITSETILKERMNAALGVYPDYMMIMIGTNDVRAMYKKSWGKDISRINTLSQVPTMALLERNLTEILHFIDQSSPNVKIALCTLPPMGEDLKAKSNDLIREANQIIERVGANYGETCTVIPVFSCFEAILEKKRKGGLPVDAFFPLSIIMNLLFHNLGIFFSWDRLSTMVGNKILTDGLHLNETGAYEVVDQIVDWLVKSNVAKAIAVKS
jgi:acyl-CoA thioesterase-1